MKILPSTPTKWYQDNGDSTLRLDYDYLDTNSVVIDIGARHGAWSDLIRNKYSPKIYCFEVIEDFCKGLENKGYHVYRKAVCDRTGRINIGVDENEGSIYHDKDIFEVDSIEASQILDLIKEEYINLVKINVEGAEYSIIENFIETNTIIKVKELQVQFHLIKEFNNRYEDLVENLSKTHSLTWRYPFIWENWKLIEK